MFVCKFMIESRFCLYPFGIPEQRELSQNAIEPSHMVCKDQKNEIANTPFRSFNVSLLAMFNVNIINFHFFNWEWHHRQQYLKKKSVLYFNKRRAKMTEVGFN